MNKRWPVRQPWTVEAPQTLTDYDEIQISVRITPMKYYEDRLQPEGERIGADSHIVMLEARDARVMGYVIRQMVENLLREWTHIEKL